MVSYHIEHGSHVSLRHVVPDLQSNEGGTDLTHSRVPLHGSLCFCMVPRADYATCRA